MDFMDLRGCCDASPLGVIDVTDVIVVLHYRSYAHARTHVRRS